jgi:hypothetical protein
MTVVFSRGAATSAVAPAAPMRLPAAGQHTRDPEPKSAPHDSKAKHARKGSSHENARGPTLLAGRAQPEAREIAQRLSLSPSLHIGRACAAGRGRGPKRPHPLHPPRPPEHARAHPRLTSVTVVFFWSAAARAVTPAAPILLSAAGQHTRDPEPKSVQHDSKAKQTQEALANENTQGPEHAGRASEARGALSFSSLPEHCARLRGGPRPWAQASPNPSIPRGHPSTLAHRRGRPP